MYVFPIHIQEHICSPNMCEKECEVKMKAKPVSDLYILPYSTFCSCCVLRAAL